MSEYNINDIKSLDFREGVRTRINMYLGSNDNEGTYQALKEIINNSTDEALAGFGNKIFISINEKENIARVEDEGRGVPFGIRDNGENVLVSIYSKSHTGGKFDSSVYKNASGLNGIGAKCVCLSSLDFKVNSYREGKIATAIFHKGNLIDYNEKINPDSHHTGTIIEFKPDPEVFSNGEIGYSYDRICQEIKNISYLYSGVSFIVKDEETGESITYRAQNGIEDFIKDKVKNPLHAHIMRAEASDETDKVEIAFQWGNSNTEDNYVFVNGLRCPEGGTPITGAKGALTKTFNSQAKLDVEGDLIRKGLVYVVNCSVSAPSFANQTKTKVNNANLRTLTSTAFSNAIKEMKLKYEDEFNTIVEIIKKFSKAEAAAERARKEVLNAVKDIERNQKKKVFASDKLKDAEFLGQDSTLLLVEGLSAASSMAMARDIKHFGILALRGKCINAFSNDDEKIYQNEEVKLLLSAMNITPGKYDSSKLRYGRIAICSDADADGFSIGLLIMCLLYKFAPQFVEEGRLYWLRSPLYIVKHGKKETYYYTDDEFNARRDKTGVVQRNKGLGSLDAEQAHNSMFTAEFQKMDQLIPNEESLPLLYDLMGKDSAPKRDFIFENVDFSVIKE